MTEQYFDLKLQAMEAIRRGRECGKSEQSMIGEIAEMAELSGTTSHNINKFASRLYKVSCELIDTIDLFSEGKSQKEVASILGLTPTTVCNYAKIASAIGVNVIRDTRGGVHPSNIGSILEDLRNGMTNKDIAKKHNTAVGNISKIRTKTRAQEIEETGSSSIPDGRSIVDRSAIVRKRFEEDANDPDTIAKRTRMVAIHHKITVDEVNEYNRRIAGLSEDEMEDLDMKMSAMCCEMLHSGVSIHDTYLKLHNYDWYTKMKLTEEYIESIVYGASLKSIANYAADPKNIDVIYTLENGMFCYIYIDEHGKEHRGYQPICSKLVDMLVDENGKCRRTIDECSMVQINHYAIHGVWTKAFDDQFVRFLTYKNGLDKALKKFKKNI